MWLSGPRRAHSGRGTACLRKTSVLARGKICFCFPEADRFELERREAWRASAKLEVGALDEVPRTAKFATRPGGPGASGARSEKNGFEGRFGL